LLFRDDDGEGGDNGELLFLVLP